MDAKGFIDQFSKVMKDCDDQSRRVDKSWWGVSRSVETVGKTLESGWTASLAKITGQQSKLIKGFEKWTEFIKDPAVYKDWQKNALKARDEIDKLIRQRKAPGGLTADQQKELEYHSQVHRDMMRQIRNHKIIGDLELHRMVFLPAILGTVKATAGWVEKQQEALKDSNTTLNERIRLMRDIANTQRATGASAETLAEATQSAVKYGLDLRDTYGADLTLITKMKEGMGVTVESSALLVASLKLMGQSADKVADSIATLATNTALAADEATRLAAQLTIAMATMAPGGDVNEVLKIVGGLEGAAKGLGLGSGSVFKMLEGLTTTSGFAGAGMIGMQPDEILASQENATEAFTQMAKVFEQMLRGQTGGSRSMVLDQLAELFPGSTRDSIAAASKVLAKYNEERGKATTLDQKWREQTDSFSKAWDKLKNQLGGIIHSVLMPMVAGAQKVVEAFSWVIEKLSQLEGAAWTAGIALSGAGLHSIYRLFTGLKGSPTFINAFVKFLPMLKGAAGWLGALTPKLAGLGAAGSAMAALIGVLGIGAAGAAGYGIGRLIGSLTGLDNVMQKAFGGGAKSGIQVGKGTVAPMGSMGERDWMQHIRNMRATGTGEADVYKWAMANIENIKDFQNTDPDKLGDKARQMKILESQFFGEGLARQRQLEVQAVTMTADRTVAATKEQTAILAELQDQGRMMLLLARQSRIDVQEASATKRGMEELKLTEEAVSRMNLNMLYTPNPPARSPINFP